MPEIASSLILNRSTATGFGPTGVEQAHTLLAEHGYVYLHGVPEGFDHAAAATVFGDLIRQSRGLIADIQPRPDMEDVLSSLNRKELDPHTENYEVPGLPPRYVMLWAVRPADEGGETTLADADELLATFTTEEITRLHHTPYTFTTGEGPARMGYRATATHPLLEYRPGGSWLLRFSTHELIRSDEYITDIADRIRAWFAVRRQPIKIERNAMLLWDNWRMLHARNSFTDHHRHLRRVLIAAN